MTLASGNEKIPGALREATSRSSMLGERILVSCSVI